MPNFKNTSSSGLRPVLEALRLEEFPTDKRNLYYSVGDMMVVDPRGHSIAVRDILDRIPKSDYASAEDAVSAFREFLSHRAHGERAA